MNLKKFSSSIWFALLLCLIPLAAVIITGACQTTHQEANCFLIIYNYPQQSLLKLIFDPLRTDWTCYQARELSYLIDAIDAKFIFACIKLKMAHFYSLSSIIFTIAGAMFVFYKLKKIYKIDSPLMLQLPPLLYTLVNLDSISFFRSSKPAVAFGTTVLFFYITELLKTPERFQKLRSHWYALLTILLLPYLDRMGFFIIAMVAGGSISLLILGATPIQKKFQLEDIHLRPFVFTAYAAALSTLLSVIYNFHIAPWIIYKLNGYYPSFKFQHLPEGSFYNISEGVYFITENVGHTFFAIQSDAAYIIGIVVLFLILYSAFVLQKNGLCKKYLFPILLLTIAIMIFCSGIMIKRHPAMLSPDVIYGIYFLIFEIVIINFLSLLLLESKKTIRLNKFLTFLFICGIAAQLLLIMTSGYRDGEKGHMALHRATTHYTIDLLNDPHKQQTKPLPQTSVQLIKFVHNRSLNVSFKENHSSDNLLESRK